jgi:hypothetical protein
MFVSPLKINFYREGAKGAKFSKSLLGVLGVLAVRIFILPLVRRQAHEQLLWINRGLLIWAGLSHAKPQSR